MANAHDYASSTLALIVGRRAANPRRRSVTDLGLGRRRNSSVSAGRFDEDSALSVGAQIVCACVGLTELGIEYVHAAELPGESVAQDGCLLRFLSAGRVEDL